MSLTKVQDQFVTRRDDALPFARCPPNRLAQLVERVPDASAALIQDVRISHGRTHATMPEQLPDRSDVVGGHERMRHEAMPERMAGGWTRNTGRPGRIFHGPLQHGLVARRLTTGVANAARTA